MERLASTLTHPLAAACGRVGNFSTGKGFKGWIKKQAVYLYVHTFTGRC